MSWFTAVTEFYVYNWGLVLYYFGVVATIVYLPWLAYRVGLAKGYQQRVNEEKAEQPHSRFRQRTAEADPERRARISRARIMARRQRTPNSRRIS